MQVFVVGGGVGGVGFIVFIGDSWMWRIWISSMVMMLLVIRCNYVFVIWQDIVVGQEIGVGRMDEEVDGMFVFL